MSPPSLPESDVLRTGANALAARDLRYHRRAAGAVLPLLINFLILATAILAPASAFAQEDADCLECHSSGKRDDAPDVDVEMVGASVHRRVECIGCHKDAGEDEDGKHATAAVLLGPVSCGECHDEEQEVYAESIHGRSREDSGEGDAASCVDCHGTHSILPKNHPESRVYPLNLPETCGACHSDQVLGEQGGIPIPRAYQSYVRSVHGRGLTRAGLIVSATCNSCHGSHDAQPASDPRSRVNPARVVATCGACHVGVEKEFRASVHGMPAEGGSPEMPICTSCHRSHGIQRIDTSLFRLSLASDCGHCHDRQMETYQGTYHGKATSLGGVAAAKCSDCHGRHDIRGVEDPASWIHPDNRIETCQTCHERSPEGYATFWPHADHRDRERYPILHFIWLGMSGLILGVFAFFGLHTALWAVRGIVAKIRRPAGEEAAAAARLDGKPIRRFQRFHRVTHIFVMISFLGLAVTGAPLKYSNEAWAQGIVNILGGLQTANWLHRVFAIVTFGYFFAHLGFVFRHLWRERRRGLRDLLLGPGSLVASLQDCKDVYAHFRWFLGMGPKPTWDRWTYWEKFDYWAVFWGVVIIGSSGLVMWFPELFCRFLPGWMVNVALVVHSEEALLAITFIFIVHFFNNHLRVDKFPLDPVMFTGSVPEHVFREERGREWERLKAEGRLEEMRVEPPEPGSLRFAAVAAILAWAIATALLILILTS